MEPRSAARNAMHAQGVTRPFRFRGGDPSTMRENLERLFQNRLKHAPIHAYMEKA